jgi:hypothetical protein
MIVIRQQLQVLSHVSKVSKSTAMCEDTFPKSRVSNRDVSLRRFGCAVDAKGNALSVALTALQGKSMFLTGDPGGALEDELALGWYPLPFQRKDIDRPGSRHPNRPHLERTISRAFPFSPEGRNLAGCGLFFLRITSGVRSKLLKKRQVLARSHDALVGTSRKANIDDLVKPLDCPAFG